MPISSAAAPDAAVLTDSLPLIPSDVRWVACILDNLDEFLQDHASCEKKASGMALSIASHYPDRPELLRAMADLAVEELSHYREVIRVLLDRGLAPAPDTKDTYVRRFNDTIRKGREEYLLYRLLVAAVVEARGHERFSLLANALPCGTEQKFYQAISASEDRHWQLFLRLAHSETRAGNEAISRRLAELIHFEGELIQQQPIAPRLH